VNSENARQQTRRLWVSGSAGADAEDLHTAAILRASLFICGLTWEAVSKEQKAAHSFAYGAISKRGQLAPGSDVCVSFRLTVVPSLQPSYTFCARICK